MNIFEKMTNQLKETLDSAIALALHQKNQEIDLIHLTWALLSDSQSLLYRVLQKMQVEIAGLELEVKSQASRLPQSSSVAKENITLSKNLMQALHSAEGLAVKNGDKFIAIDTLILANVESFKEILGVSVDMMELKKELITLRAGKKIDDASSDENLEALQKFGIDLTQKALENLLDPVIGRDEELSLIHI